VSLKETNVFWPFAMSSERAAPIERQTSTASMARIFLAASFSKPRYSKSSKVSSSDGHVSLRREAPV